MFRLALAVVLLMFSIALFAAESTGFSTAVKAHTMAVSVDESGIGGPGGDWLNERAAAAGLLGMGEQHATADIAKFAEAWFRQLDPMGYDHAVVEVGPWGTRAAEALLRKGDRVFEQDASDRAGGFAYPFLFFQEEVDLLRTVIARQQSSGPALWGVDQEFVGGGTLLAERLAALATTPEQRAAAADFSAGLAENPMLVGRGSAETFTALEAAFADGEGAAIVAEIIRSNRIYAPFTGRGGSGYLANREREQGMKTYFLEAWRQMTENSASRPKVFFKFGGFHMQRGHSGTDVQSFGNFLSEWGHAEGLSFFNVMLDCDGGEVTDPRSGETSACETYYASSDGDFGGLAAEGPVVVNLEALRPLAYREKGLDAGLRKLIFAYDAYVILPDVAPASQLIVND